ncbi:MAG: hypothetical protein HQL63_02745 [Magnetococcales bacterium]|nr:hypothetical protein [Magnetococcales bacterium]
MEDSAGGTSIATKMDRLMSILEKVPETSKGGFSNIADHMGHFSGSFAASASRAVLIKERIDSSGDMGLHPLRKDMEQIHDEVEKLFVVLDKLIVQKSPLVKRLEKITDWGLQIEQRAFLPRVVDQIKSQNSERMERHTLGSMIDNLMEQTSPLINEIVSSSQETRDVLEHLMKRLGTDMEISKSSLDGLQKSAEETIQSMFKEVAKVQGICTGMEKRSDQVGSVVFEMVQAMQFDDIASQRVHHALEGLRQAKEKLQLAATADDPATNEKAVQWSLIAIRITIRQLEDTCNDLVGAIKTMQEHLASIGTIAEEQVTQLAQARSITRRFHQHATDITYLMAGSQRLGIFDDTLSNEVLKTLSKADSGVFQARRAMDMLIMTSQRLESISASMKTGGNNRLDSLVASIRSLVKSIIEENPLLSEELNKAVDRIQKISLSYSENTTPRLMRTNTLLRRIPLTTQQMDTSNNDLIRLFHESLVDARATSTQVTLLMAEMDFHREINDIITNVLAGLRKLMRDVAGDQTKYLDGDLHDLSGEFADLSKLYTMNSERKIHESELDGQATTTDDGGDDIELF